MTKDHPKPATDVSADFYRLLCEHAPIAMLATDTQFRVVLFNPAAVQLLGKGLNDMLGQPMVQAVPVGRRKLLERLLRRTIHRGVTTQFEVRLPNAQGVPSDLVVVLSPVFAKGCAAARATEPFPGERACPGAPPGEAGGVTAWIIDETGRKRLADRLAQAEKMASLGTLAGGVAHHFNNILGGVATFVDFALTSNDPVAMKRALQMTAEAAARASKITQSLLSFAEHDSRRSDLADLTEVVLTFAHLIERPLAAKKIELRLNLSPVPVIAVEANRMHQVLGNLLTNAEEAMPDGGQLSISVRRIGNEVHLQFADTGCGIKPEHLPLVFEPFFTTKGLLAGGDRANPGLGLSIVHGIILEMGAHIEVQSEVAVGTPSPKAAAEGPNRPDEAASSAGAASAAAAGSAKSGTCFTIIYPVTRVSDE